MNYVIVGLIRGRAKNYQKKLTEEISRKFKIIDVSKRIEPHITLKDLGGIKSKKVLEEINEFIKDFSKKNRAVRYELKGINHFGKEVIFIDVLPSKRMQYLYKSFYSGITDLEGVIEGEFEDKKMHFHATLAVDNIPKKFNKIYNFLSDRKPYYKGTLDNITIMRNINKKWRVYKSYKLTT